MKSKVYSSLLENYYYPDECVRVVNQLQAASYWINGCAPVDIYPSRDLRTGQAIIVYVFNREKSKPLYEKWNNYELK